MCKFGKFTSELVILNVVITATRVSAKVTRDDTTNNNIKGKYIYGLRSILCTSTLLEYAFRG